MYIFEAGRRAARVPWCHVSTCCCYGYQGVTVIAIWGLCRHNSKGHEVQTSKRGFKSSFHHLSKEHGARGKSGARRKRVPRPIRSEVSRMKVFENMFFMILICFRYDLFMAWFCCYDFDMVSVMILIWFQLCFLMWVKLVI